PCALPVSGGVGVWPAVVGVRGLRSCGRAPAQSILHASWIQDVAECRMARSRPRSDMEASTISYLRAALSEFFGAGGEPEPASVTGTWTGHGRSHGRMRPRTPPVRNTPGVRRPA